MDHRVVELRRPALFCSNRPRWRVYIDSVYRPPSRVCTWMVNGSNIGLAFVPFVCLGPALSVSISTSGPQDSLRRIALRESKTAIAFVRGKNHALSGFNLFIYLLEIRRPLYFIFLPPIYILNNKRKKCWLKEFCQLVIWVLSSWSCVDVRGLFQEFVYLSSTR